MICIQRNCSVIRVEKIDLLIWFDPNLVACTAQEIESQLGLNKSVTILKGLNNNSPA